MNYKKTIDFLYSKLPMFTRIGAVAIKKDLHNTLAMCEALQNPQNQFKTIHVGGTNGKGSTSHMLAAILQQAGYKTGLYTSPHLKDFRERIRINGKKVNKSFVSNFVAQNQELINRIEPSFFEVTVAMAFDYFAKQEVDVAVIEVGLGGRLDSTNVITPELSVITNISLDHTNLLGNTLGEIASEKAGIIKKKIPVVIGEKKEETQSLFMETAQSQHAPIYFAQTELEVVNPILKRSQLEVNVYHREKLKFPKLKLDLTGWYQLKNVATVITSILVLRERKFKIEDVSIYQALKKVKKLTGLQGRWQIIQKKPLVICDTGHNEAGIREVIQNIQSTPHKKLHMVIGMVKDKDIDSVLAFLPQSATYYFCKPDLERALPANELEAKAKHFGLCGYSYDTVDNAFKSAKLKANQEDLVFVGGSTFVVAEIL